jgi:hypothetical protein
MEPHPFRPDGTARYAAWMSPRAEAVIEVHAVELRQVFDTMDPSPFPDRDIDPRTAAYILDSARELPRHAVLANPPVFQRSMVVPRKKNPGDVVTVNSRVIFESETTGEAA